MQMNKIFYSFFTLLFIACVNAQADELPEWISKQDCGDNICAVGYGDTLDKATTDARNNIQRIFETKVSSKFQNEVTEFKDEASEILYEESEGILKGTTIDKVFEKNGDFYVLAVLDRKKAADDIEFDIKMLDRKMAVLINDDSLSSSKKLNEMYEKREDLNKKYLFLTGKEIVEEVEYKDVFDNNKHNFSQTGSYYVNVEDSEINAFLTNLLIESGVKVVNNSTSAKNILNAEITNKKEFLNVDDFEKYSVTLNLQLISGGKVLKSMNKKVTETGLSYEQIYSKAIEQIGSYLEKNIINILE